MQILITNGGPHPAEKWAAATAKMICNLIQIDPQSSVAAQANADKSAFESAITQRLIAMHHKIQAQERTALSDDAAHINSPIDPRPFANQAVTEVASAAANTLFEPDFARPEVRAFVFETTGQIYLDSIVVERKWFADAKPNDPHVQAYLANPITTAS